MLTFATDQLNFKFMLASLLMQVPFETPSNYVLKPNKTNLNLVKLVKDKISKTTFTQRFDDSMAPFSSKERIKMIV